MTKTREEFSQDNYPNEVLLSLQESWDNILSQDCEELGISKEDLLIRLVRKYVYFDRFTEREHTINLTWQSFFPIIDKIAEVDIKRAANAAGRTVPRNLLKWRGFEISKSSIEMLMEEVYSRYGGWFNYRKFEEGTSTIYELSHLYGEKWSIYLSNYVLSMFKSLLDLSLNLEYKHNLVRFWILD
jgi:hypothetical protein